VQHLAVGGRELEGDRLAALVEHLDFVQLEGVHEVGDQTRGRGLDVHAYADGPVDPRLKPQSTTMISE